jgi:hypothetical protein
MIHDRGGARRRDRGPRLSTGRKEVLRLGGGQLEDHRALETGCGILRA